MAERLLTASGMKAYRACPRRYEYAYVDGVRPTRDAPALVFGTVMHRGLEAYWRARQARRPRAAWLAAAVDAVRAGPLDPYEAAKAVVLMRAYAAVWDRTWARVLAVEARFRTPLLHPETGAPHAWFDAAGKLDLVVQLRDGRVALVEHKGSSADVGPGSAYRRRLSLDEQVSYYLTGARSLGYEPDVIVYDVLRKFAERPLKATPEDERTYTKPTAKELVPRLRKGQRESDETPAEFEARLFAAALGGGADRRVERVALHRLRRERAAFDLNVWRLADAMAETERLGRWFYNSDACLAYHGAPCPYLEACEGAASLDDAAKFRRLADPHPELAEDVA